MQVKVFEYLNLPGRRCSFEETAYVTSKKRDAMNVKIKHYKTPKSTTTEINKM